MTVEQVPILLLKVLSVSIIFPFICLRCNMERAAVDGDGSADVAVDHAPPFGLGLEAAGVHLQRSAV